MHLEVELKRLAELDAENERKEESRITKFLSEATNYLEVPFSKMGKYWEMNKYCWEYKSFLFDLLSLKWQLASS